MLTLKNHNIRSAILRTNFFLLFVIFCSIPQKIWAVEASLEPTSCHYIQLREKIQRLDPVRTPANDLYRMTQALAFNGTLPHIETHLADLRHQLSQIKGTFIWRKEAKGHRGVVVVVPEDGRESMGDLLQDLDEIPKNLQQVSPDDSAVSMIEGNWQNPVDKQSLLQRCASNLASSFCAITGMSLGANAFSQYFFLNSISRTQVTLAASLLFVAHLTATDRLKSVFSYLSVLPDTLSTSREKLNETRKKLEDVYDYYQTLFSLKTGFDTQVNADHLSQFFSTLNGQLESGQSFVTFVSADLIDYGNLTGPLRDQPTRGANTPIQRLTNLGWTSALAN